MALPGQEGRRREVIDLQRYGGTWYEIAAFPQVFEAGCSNVTAQYSLNDDGSIQVVNTCLVNGRLRQVEGRAVPTSEDNSKLKVSFFPGMAGDYWIEAIDPNYQWALVGSPARDSLWILSRTKQLSQTVVDDLVAQAYYLGYDVDRLRDMVQT